MPARYKDAAPPKPRPKHYKDELPPIPPVAVSVDEPELTTSSEDQEPIFDDPMINKDLVNQEVIADIPYSTERNSYDIFRMFQHGRPSWMPEENLFASTENKAQDTTTQAQGIPEYFAPFTNASIFRLISWMHTGSVLKTVGELDRLVDEVILADDFKRIDLLGFRAQKELKRLDKPGPDGSNLFTAEEGWKEGSVEFALPAERVRQQSEREAPTFTVSGVYYREPLALLKSALQKSSMCHFHLTPYHDYWHPESYSEPERLIGEV
ncbi:MAG TPA: hypothetical protein VGO47_01790 [Chlamydiales bacterium]|nr:hypothetical protein [Chlamydiales bacterium]